MALGAVRESRLIKVNQVIFLTSTFKAIRNACCGMRADSFSFASFRGPAVAELWQAGRGHGKPYRAPGKLRTFTDLWVGITSLYKVLQGVTNQNKQSFFVNRANRDT